MNRLALDATVVEVTPLRYTPAGLPAIELQLNHESDVLEAGVARRVELVLSAVALGDVAIMLAGTALGSVLSVEGFLAPTRKGSPKMVLHLQQASRQVSAGT